MKEFIRLPRIVKRRWTYSRKCRLASRFSVQMCSWNMTSPVNCASEPSLESFSIWQDEIVSKVMDVAKSITPSSQLS